MRTEQQIKLDVFKQVQTLQALTLELMAVAPVAPVAPTASAGGLPEPVTVDATTIDAADFAAPAQPTQEVFYLPRDSRPEEMNAVYGEASKNFDAHLDWFHWPSGCDARLYDRGGEAISDHTPTDAIFADDHRTNKVLARRVTSALVELWERLGSVEFYKQGWHVWGGSHNYRVTTSGGRLSTHSWAAACDWNPTENGYRSKTTTFSDEALDCWERHGFLAAGRAWVTTPDWMHSQSAIPSISKGSYYDKHGLPPWIRPLSEKP